MPIWPEIMEGIKADKIASKLHNFMDFNLMK